MQSTPKEIALVRSAYMRRERAVPALLWLTGLGLAAMSITADLRGGGDGFGLIQILMVLMGCALVFQGMTLATPSGWQVVGGWWEQPLAARWTGVLQFSVVTGQLVLLLLVIQQFRVESPAFYEKVVPLCVFGFVVHHLLSLRWRLPFFVALSLAALVAVFGPASAAWLVGIGVTLVLMCHLPIGFGWRVLCVLLAGGALAAMRAGAWTSPWSGAIWPILGSMFMFRLILYMYDLRHSREPASFTRALAYFFLLPNVAFPLFPVVDFATFRRTYYDQNAIEIYQRGIRWMLRGVAHLIVYRFVYQHLVISQADVATSAQLAQYLVANFLLYLRVSGQFHLIVGMLHLFGFRLPETHRFFYLSASFTDFWRRINIYWKEFMMKVVYYPAYFRLRKRGNTIAIVVSTLAVFVVTWFLHAYQWFWLLGRFLLSWTDVIFWSILAVLLVVNSLWENKKGRTRTLGQRGWNVRYAAWLALRITTTFTVLCVLWSLWTSPTVRDWLALWNVGDLTAAKVALAALTLYAGAFLLVAVFRQQMEGEDVATKARVPAGFARGALATSVITLGLYTLGSPAFSKTLGLRAQELIRDLKVTELNKSEASMLQRGYYEELVGVNRFNGQLWEVYSSRPELWRMPTIETTGAARWLDNYLRIELRPMMGTPYLDGTFRTNRWGMRDRDYERVKPIGAYRVALMGPSHVAGWGVSDFEVFEHLLENKMNSSKDSVRFEILNFAVPSWSIPQQLIALESRVLEFDADAVWLVATPKDGEVAAHHLWNMLRRGYTVPFDYLRDVAARAGVVGTTPEAEATRRLRPFEDEIIRETYTRFAQAAREHGVKPVWVYLSLPGYRETLDGKARLITMAEAAGFTVLDMSNVYDGHDLARLQYAKWDEHPNAAGHQVIAEGIYSALLKRPDVVRLTSKGTGQPGQSRSDESR